LQLITKEDNNMEKISISADGFKEGTRYLTNLHARARIFHLHFPGRDTCGDEEHFIDNG